MLIIPLLVWNLAFASTLPPRYGRDVFWADIPQIIAVPETFFRVAVFFLPLAMPLALSTPVQRFGLSLYLVGTTIYFLSWLAQIHAPDSAWSMSLPGFLGPALTPLPAFAGIALMARGFYFGVPYATAIYLAVAVGFTVFHTAHTALVHSRLS